MRIYKAQDANLSYERLKALGKRLREEKQSSLGIATTDHSVDMSNVEREVKLKELDKQENTPEKKAARKQAANMLPSTNALIGTDTRTQELRDYDNRVGDYNARQLLYEENANLLYGSLGGFADRVLRPSKWVGGIARRQPLGDYLANGNNGLVTDKFAEENPELAEAINFAGDIAIPYGVYTYSSPYRWKGLYDATKYGILDRILGYNLYRQYRNNKGKRFNPFYEDTSYSEGAPFLQKYGGIYSDRGDYATIHNFPYTRVFDLKDWTTRAHLAAITPRRGESLPKAMSYRLFKEFNNLPSGTVLSADAPGITVLESMELSKYPYLLLLLGGSRRGYHPYGLSADSYSLLTKLGLKPGHALLYTGGKSGAFNGAGVENAAIEGLLKFYSNGRYSATKYVDELNKWMEKIGGRPAHIDFFTGEPVIYHPAVFTK